MRSFKHDQCVEEEICDKYVVELSLGDLPKVSCYSVVRGANPGRYWMTT